MTEYAITSTGRLADAPVTVAPEFAAQRVTSTRTQIVFALFVVGFAQC